MFEKTTPEQVGISSKDVLEFIKTLEDCRFNIHSILMAKGDKIFSECYYKPFNPGFVHRMYSVSKTFVAVATGLAITEGIMSLDDVIVDYFPEFRNENTDVLYDECTVRDMLSMQSNIGSGMQWWGRFKSRVEAYYSKKSDKISKTLYFYDSIGSFLLGCIIEKLTGKDFLEYLKEKVLYDIGFSKESFTLREPGGFTVGDSGVMCTTRDLALFARFMMKKGEWNQKQYIDREFMENAITKQTTNDLLGTFNSYNTKGYGYLTWITGDNSFSLVGMGDQLAVCDMNNDFLFVITSDNQADRAGRHVLFHELYRHFIPKIQKEPLCECEEDYKKLEEYLNSRKLICQYGEAKTSYTDKIKKVKFVADKNSLGISYFKLDLSGSEGVLELGMDKVIKLPFGIGENKEIRFSFGERARADMMGIYEEGEYACAASGAWVEENTFAIKNQVTDTYFGCLNVYISFKDNRATLCLKKSGQYVFDGFEGYVTGKSE